MPALVQAIRELEEVIANGGYIPARSIDAFAINARFASDILKANGITPDCDIHAGTKVGGGTPADCQGPLNTFLATATATNPVTLIIDCGMALGKTLTIKPHTTITTLSGRKQWDVGFFMKSASHAGAISCGLGTTDQNHFDAIHPPGTQSIAGTNVTLAGFYVNCNRGTYPTGCNNNYLGDGTLTSNGAYVNDARGITNYYYLGGITIVGVENLTIDNVWVYDACAYGIDIYHSTHITITRCRVEAVDSQTGNNTDAIHINGSCSTVWIAGCFLKSGDDPLAINIHEGDGGSGSDILIENCIVDALTLGRIYGISTTSLKRVQIRGISGTVRWWGFLIGQGNTFVDNVADSNRSIIIRDIDVQITVGDGPLPPAMLMVCANAGIIDAEFLISDPIVAHPVVYMSALTGAVGLLEIGVKVRRSSLGSAAVNLVTGVSGTIQNLRVNNWSITDGGSYSAVPNFLSLTSPCSVTQFWAGNIDPAHITAFVDHAGQVGSKAGPGLTASGF